MSLSDISITTLETITVFSLNGDYLFTLDELQDTTISQTQEKSDVTGKGGRKLTSLKKNKAVTISGNDGLVSSGLLELQTGRDVESGTQTVAWSDYLRVDSGHTATTQYKAFGAAGSEITDLYTLTSDGLLDKHLTQGTLDATGVAPGTVFEYDDDNKVLTFDETIMSGTEIVVFYNRRVEGSSISNLGDSYSRKATIYVDAFGEDKCGNQYRIQFFFPKADFNGEFSIDLGGDQAVHAFEAEALTGACGTKGELWTYTVFGYNTPDAKNGIFVDSDGERRYYENGVAIDKGLASDGTNIYYFGEE